MANINDFKGIPPITWSFIVAMMISTIIPGLLLVFLFREDLFMTETIVPVNGYNYACMAV